MDYVNTQTPQRQFIEALMERKVWRLVTLLPIVFAL